MRVHVSSASAAVIRTLEQIVTLSGHTPATESEAELTLVDQLHPTTCASAKLRIEFGGKSSGNGQFLNTPFAPNQLLKLLRSQTSNQTAILGNGWSIDQTARTLTNTGLAINASLTEKESALLTSLIDAFPNAMKHDALLAEVWGVRSGIDTHTLETHIYRLRSKLDALSPRPCDIVTVNGAYKLTID